MRQRLLADKIANLGVGLIIGSFILSLSDTISFKEQLGLVLLGIVNVALGIIMYPDE